MGRSCGFGSRILAYSQKAFQRRLNRTYSPKVIEAWSTVSCEASELYKVNVLLASPLRWHRSSRPQSPSIKLSKSAGSEPQP